MNRKKLFGLVMCGAMLLASTSVFTSCKDYNDDINDLQSQIDGLNSDLSGKITALQTAMSAAQAALTQAQADIVKAQAAADAAQSSANAAAQAAAAADAKAAAAAEAAAQAKIDAIAAAQKMVDELKATLQAQIDGKVDQSVYDAKMEELDGQIAAINGSLKSIQEALGFDSETGTYAVISLLNQQVAALNTFMESIEKLNLTETYPTLLSDVATLKTELASLQDDVKQNSDDIVTLQNTVNNVVLPKLTELSDAITALDEKLNVLIQQRLTSLIFDDTQSVNGIPAVTFMTLNYAPWTLNEDGIPVEPADDAEAKTINGNEVANYYLNPSSVDLASITALDVLLKEGTNIITRADAEPTLTVEGYTVENGVMAVTLSKTGTFATTTTTSTSEDITVESFNRFAVQATILPTSADEEAPTVTSGFARIFDYSGTPAIYNATEPMKPSEEADEFFTYEEITADTDEDFVVANVAYNATLDLNTLAKTVVNGLPIDMEKYGLTFEFSLLEESTVVSIDAAGVISATDQSVVGSTTSIQVVLKDGDNIVDAAYFDILWTAAGETDLGLLGTFDFDFDAESCEISYSDTVFSDVLKEKVYDVLGIDEATFVSLYSLNAGSFGTSATATAGTPAVDTLGVLSYVENTNVEDNPYVIVWDLDIVDSPITQAEYNAGVAVRTVYGRFEGKSTSNSSVYVFSLQMNITLDQMTFAGAYLSTYWEGSPIASTNDSKVRVVNPTMMSDAVYGTSNFYSTQIIASLMAGYTEKFTAPLDLVNGATSAKFIFDAERIASMTATLGANWEVSAAGDTLYYKYESGLVAAAAISAEGVINLVEDPAASSTVPGTPTDAAIKLLALADNKVPVKLVGAYCSGGDTELTGAVDKFLVRFIKPLTMTVVAPDPNIFYDLEQKGYTIDVSTLVTITGFGSTGVVLSSGNSTSDTEALQKWFNVTAVNWDLDNAITNLVEDAAGNISVSSSTNYADWSDWNTVKGKYDFTSTDATVGGIDLTQTLTFINFSGSALTESFKVAIPVVATTKWNTELYDVNQQYVEFVIQPGDIN